MNRANISSGLQATQYNFISEIPDFPLSSLKQIRSLNKKGKIRFWFPSGESDRLISKFGDLFDIKRAKTIFILQTIVIWIGILLPLILAFSTSNYWLILCSLISYLGVLSTSVSKKRGFFLLIALILLVASFFVDGLLLKSVFLFFGLSNFAINYLRFIKEGTVLKIILSNEYAFVWGYSNIMFMIESINGNMLIPGLAEDIQRINYKLFSIGVFS